MTASVLDRAFCSEVKPHRLQVPSCGLNTVLEFHSTLGAVIADLGDHAEARAIVRGSLPVGHDQIADL